MNCFRERNEPRAKRRLEELTGSLPQIARANRNSRIIFELPVDESRATQLRQFPTALGTSDRKDRSDADTRDRFSSETLQTVMVLRPFDRAISTSWTFRTRRASGLETRRNRRCCGVARRARLAGPDNDGVPASFESGRRDRNEARNLGDQQGTTAPTIGRQIPRWATESVSIGRLFDHRDVPASLSR